MEQKYKDILNASTILLVDDDFSLRHIFKKTIKSYVAKVVEAENGQEAFELYHKEKPNVIITDIRMPLMDGATFTSKLRELDEKIPIIAISAYTEPEILVQLLSLKLVDYLVKPINFDQLLSSLEKASKEIEEKGVFEISFNSSTSYSFSKKGVVKDGNLLSLTPKEISLLELLIRNRNRIVTKDELEFEVYDGEFASDNAINTLISKLRKKIGANILQTVSSQGYLLTI
jgi:DNA-binding response OmpR family regulator